MSSAFCTSSSTKCVSLLYSSCDNLLRLRPSLSRCFLKISSCLGFSFIPYPNSSRRIFIMIALHWDSLSIHSCSEGMEDKLLVDSFMEASSFLIERSHGDLGAEALIDSGFFEGRVADSCGKVEIRLHNHILIYYGYLFEGVTIITAKAKNVNTIITWNYCQSATVFVNRLQIHHI